MNALIHSLDHPSIHPLHREGEAPAEPKNPSLRPERLLPRPENNGLDGSLALPGRRREGDASRSPDFLRFGVPARGALAWLLLAAGLLAAPTGRAAVLYTFSYHSGFANSRDVPDGNPNPWSDTRTISAIPAGHTITDVTVQLDLSGGYNGDLYGYLSYHGTLVPLLNRPGVGTGNLFGYGDGGLNVEFTDGASDNIHFYQTVPGYSIGGGATWQPDGRDLNPLTSAPGDFDAAGTLALADFAGMNPNGDWTLVLADVSAGGGQTTVNSWGLSITTTAVPEPGDWALLTAGALLLLAAVRPSNAVAADVSPR